MSPATVRPAMLCVDIGNSAIKVGGFVCDQARRAALPEPEWVADYRHDHGGLETLSPVGSDPQHPQVWRVASVQRQAEQRLARLVRETRPQDDYRVLCHLDFPLEIDVEFPDRVGTDRLAAASAANQLRSSDRHAIIIDAGSAITVDLVDRSGVFRGGVILAGTDLTARALSEKTDLLPRVELSTEASAPPVVGRSTEAAIRSGLFWGTVGAAREVVDRMARALDAPVELFISGGDARKLHSYLDHQPRLTPNLVLRGIAHAALRNIS